MPSGHFSPASDGVIFCHWVRRWGVDQRQRWRRRRRKWLRPWQNYSQFPPSMWQQPSASSLWGWKGQISAARYNTKSLARRRKRLQGASDGFDLTSCLAAAGQRSHMMVMTVVRLEGENKDKSWFGIIVSQLWLGGLTMKIGFFYFVLFFWRDTGSQSSHTAIWTWTQLLEKKRWRLRCSVWPRAPPLSRPHLPTLSCPDGQRTPLHTLPLLPSLQFQPCLDKSVRLLGCLFRFVRPPFCVFVFAV